MAERLAPGDRIDDEEEVELTRETFKEQLKLLIEGNRVRDEALAKRKAGRKQAKVHVELMKMDQIIKMMEWEPSEIRDYIRGLLQYMEFADLLGKREQNAQVEMFPPKEPSEQAKEDWKLRGLMAATLGKGTFGTPPSECPPDYHQDWLAGVHEGTAANGKKLQVVK